MIGLIMLYVFLVWAAIYMGLMLWKLNVRPHWVWRVWISVVTFAWFFVALFLHEAGI